jgi:hypothetical protein
MIKSLMSRAGLSWAHLAGIGTARASDDDNVDDKPKDDKGAKGSKASDDEEPPKQDDKAKGAKGAKAEDDDERKKRDDESDDEYSKRMKSLDDKDDEKAKGAKGSKADDDSNADDDDKDEEMRGNSAAASARRREQARCAAIFASSAAGKNPVLAAKLAFETRQPRSEALALLEGTPAPAAATPPTDPRSRHAARGTGNPNITPPGAPEKNAGADVQNLWAHARKANQALRR